MADSIDRAKKRKDELDDFRSFDDLLPKKSKSTSQGADYKRAEPVDVGAEQRKEVPDGTKQTL